MSQNLSTQEELMEELIRQGASWESVKFMFVLDGEESEDIRRRCEVEGFEDIEDIDDEQGRQLLRELCRMREEAIVFYAKQFLKINARLPEISLPQIWYKLCQWTDADPKQHLRPTLKSE